MLVQLTNAGAALIAAAGGPIQLSAFQLGSDYGYTPSPTDTTIHGSLIYAGAPSPYSVVNANVVRYSSYLDFDLGPFAFGEIGLFTSTGVLFALGVLGGPLQKTPISAGITGNSIRVDMYLSMVGTNYTMWLDYADSSNQFQLAVLGSVDQLPPPQNAIPNAYVITGKTAGQSSFQAYTDRTGLWNFDAYAFADQAAVTIQSFDSQSITIPLSQYLAGMNPAYPGQVILEFSSGTLFGICRYVSSAVISGSSVTLGFDNPLMQTPVVGDTAVVFARQALSTTIPNLPIASPTVLGAIKVGTTLTIAGDGTLNVAASAYPVISVNGKTGVVILQASDIVGLATVATTGNYNDLFNKPTPYALPIASTSTLGGVKAPSDSNLTIAGDGTIDLGFNPVKTVNSQTPDGNGNVVVTIPVIGLVAPTQIPNGADVNLYQTTGLFFVLDADSPSLLNGPGTAAGRPGAVLEIEPFTTTATGGDVIQRWTETDGIYFRRYKQATNVWTPWVNVATSVALPIASDNSLGVVQIGTGLNITTGGLLTTVIQTVNGKSAQNVVLQASDVGAVAVTQVNQPGGVPSLDSNTGGTPVPATDPYTYGRLPFQQNTLGVWWNAGTWDASANHVAQTGAASLTVTDTNTSLLANGQQLVDISYGGDGVAGLPVPDYQTVSAEGMVYQVIVAGTTNLDGYSQWNVGDLAVVVNGKWMQIIVNFANVVFSAGTF